MAQKKSKPIKKKNKSRLRGTRKSSLVSKRSKSAGQNTIRRWLKWGALGSVCVILILWSAAWFFLSTADTQMAQWITAKIYNTTVRAGFSVQNIHVEGREFTNADALMAVINITRGDPIFSFDPHGAREQISKISWVESVQVQRRLPDTIYIKLEERQPIALWKGDGDLALIDKDGEVLTYQGLNQFNDLVMVRGEGANDSANDLIGLLNAEPDLKKLVDHAALIDRRRWNLILKDDKVIKLPAQDMGLAIRALMQKHHSDNILRNDVVTSVDVRYQGRLIVSTKLGKVQHYKTETVDTGTAL